MIPTGMFFNQRFSVQTPYSRLNSACYKKLHLHKVVDFAGDYAVFGGCIYMLAKAPVKILLTYIPTGMYDFFKCRFRPCQGVPKGHSRINDY
jgi:hypothetical protein